MRADFSSLTFSLPFSYRMHETHNQQVSFQLISSEK